MTDDRNFDIKPPEKVLRILRVFCPQHLLEEIEGDLVQRFQKDVTRLGRRGATSKFLWSAIRFCRPGIILRNRFSIDIIRFAFISVLSQTLKTAMTKPAETLKYE